MTIIKQTTLSVNMKFYSAFIFCLLFIVGYLLIKLDYIGISSLLEFQNSFENFSYFKALAIFILVYISYALASMPGLLVLDLIAGALFGPIIGFFAAWLSAVSGAFLVFLASRYFFSSYFFSRYENNLKKIQRGFQRHETNYLIFLRVVPLMPFGLINISLGLIQIKAKQFFWTTFFGVLPISFLYTHIGSEIKDALLQDQSLSSKILWNPFILSALAVLSVFVLLPIFIKKRKEPDPVK
jgi:uncharacterized membrane protein YdjX (TVP38/TMEM64 family)